MLPETQQKPLRLALIGMSGTGKTFWTKRLEAVGWPTISCDDQIEAMLTPRLAAGAHAGINGVAAWMGWPDSATYSERESNYLAAEIRALDEILTHLQKDPAKSLVLDTTGSVIYAGNNLLMRLRRQMTVVHLAASPDQQQLLMERYLQDPKPVLWRGAFRPKPGEAPKATVSRCYPALIAARRQSYEALAHCTLQVAELRGLAEESPNASPSEVARAFPQDASHAGPHVLSQVAKQEAPLESSQKLALETPRTATLDASGKPFSDAAGLAAAFLAKIDKELARKL